MDHGRVGSLFGHSDPEDVSEPGVHRDPDLRDCGPRPERPGGFVPEEDQGFIMVNAQLPDAASLERTDAVMRKAEAILEKNEAIEGFNTISGYSLLTSAYSSNMGFFFVQLKPWEERHSAESHAAGVVNALNRAFTQAIPKAGSSHSGPLRFRGSGPEPGLRSSCRIAAAERRTTWPGRPTALWKRRGSGRRSDASTRSIGQRFPKSTPTSIEARCSNRACC